MHGKSIHIELLVLLLICLWSAPVRAAQESAVVAILLSDSEEAYGRPVTTFSEEIERPVSVFNLHGDIMHDPDLKEKLFAARPALIFALGAKAAYAARLWTEERRDIPVIFAMVLNWQRYKLTEGRENMAGIAAEMAPGTQFANMIMFSPAVRRIGLLYSPQSGQIFDQAREAADLLGLELVAESIDHSRDLRLAFKKISAKVDAFWVLNDPLIYTMENLDWLEKRCVRDKLFCVGQTLNIAKLGLTLSVNSDNDQLGVQAGAMARNILERGQTPKDIGVMAPLNTQIIVNLNTAAKIGTNISPQALDLATSIIGR
ncbi:MAG: hypothetical protein HY885_12180 [Deltaproteobacteria bacterium]|nr:hypothetical protein [Deltaproteobacteria bacterium]